MAQNDIHRPTLPRQERAPPVTTDETKATTQQPAGTVSPQERPTFDTSVAHIARVYYLH